MIYTTKCLNENKVFITLEKISDNLFRFYWGREIIDSPLDRGNKHQITERIKWLIGKEFMCNPNYFKTREFKVYKEVLTAIEDM